jgi:hypothetical protein
MEEEAMRTRREFLGQVGMAIGTATLLAVSICGKRQNNRGTLVPNNATARHNMERWLLSTSKNSLDPTLIEIISQQIAGA